MLLATAAGALTQESKIKLSLKKVRTFYSKEHGNILGTGTVRGMYILLKKIIYYYIYIFLYIIKYM